MIIFWTSAALMVLAALALILRPLLSNRPLSALDQRDVNLSIYHRRQRELKADQAAGLLTDETADEARLELQRQLLGDMDVEPSAPVRRQPAYMVAVAVAFLLPIATIALYLNLGSLEAEEQIAASSMITDNSQDQVAFIREHLSELQEKVRAEPRNLEAVLMLARAYMVLEQFDAAVAVYAAAESWAGEHVPFLVDYAEAIAYAQDGALRGRPTELLERGLNIEPGFPKALWMAGLAAMQSGQPERTRQYWQQLMAVLPPESESAAQIRQLLTEIDQVQLPGGTQTPEAVVASLQVEVSLSPELAQSVSADSTVFVLARPADGQRAPVAAVRRSARELPFSITLDESMAMVAGMSLKEFPQVVVEARVSHSGDALSQAGDLLGQSGPVSVDDKEAVVIVIDRVIE